MFRHILLLTATSVVVLTGFTCHRPEVLNCIHQDCWDRQSLAVEGPRTIPNGGSATYTVVLTATRELNNSGSISAGLVSIYSDFPPGLGRVELGRAEATISAGQNEARLPFVLRCAPPPSPPALPGSDNTVYGANGVNSTRGGRGFAVKLRAEWGSMQSDGIDVTCSSP
jgi:hypothetical protein